MTVPFAGRGVMPQVGLTPLISMIADGPTLVAAAAASMLDASGKIVGIPANYWAIGKQWLVKAQGRISCVVTTPGTARVDLRLGAAGASVAFDTRPAQLERRGQGDGALGFGSDVDVPRDRCGGQPVRPGHVHIRGGGRFAASCGRRQRELDGSGWNAGSWRQLR